MLNITASMAVAFRQLATAGLAAEGHADLLRRRRRGGRRHLGRRVDVRPPLGRDRADYVLTEIGGWSTVGRRRRAPRHGQHRREGHRLAPPARHRHARPRLDAVRRRQRAGQGGRDRAPARRVPAGRRRSTTCGGRRSPRWRCPTSSARRSSTRPDLDALATLPAAVARTCHARTHTTFSPNVVHGGQKTNTIPDVVDIDVDIRTVPGTSHADVMAMLHEALGDLAPVEVSDLQHSDPRSAGPATSCGAR